jgi:hypothetical protein
MQAARPSADVVAANVINGVMFVVCGVAMWAFGAWACPNVFRQGGEGYGPPADTALTFALISLFAGVRFIRRGLILIRRRAERESAE